MVQELVTIPDGFLVRWLPDWWAGLLAIRSSRRPGDASVGPLQGHHYLGRLLRQGHGTHMPIRVRAVM